MDVSLWFFWDALHGTKLQVGMTSCEAMGEQVARHDEEQQ